MANCGLLPAFRFLLVLFSLLVVILGCQTADGGIIKDVFKKVIGSNNNKTDDVVQQSAPICGNNLFSTSNQDTISPEFIFITSRPSKTVHSHGSGNHGIGDSQWMRRDDEVNEVAKEFRFHQENVTLDELERHGFNRHAPVSFVMHGFTSGYPLQAWISAIVESYTIDRETNEDTTSSPFASRRIENHQRRSGSLRNNLGSERPVKHNLFIINWHYAARGIHYPRAVANIPKVATYVTRFINEKLLGEARMDSNRIQLIGHSLGAHLAGFIGKNTRSKLGRIYGLDPAGPCFGTISGPLYPSSKRLSPNDAQEVITLHTNSALLGIGKPLGRYSVFVEGGASQPGCKGGGFLKSISALTLDGDDIDDISCSHGRAPNLLTYRLDQSNSQDDCQMVAYECTSWDDFVKGRCGVCDSPQGGESTRSTQRGPMQPVECLRVGLDWQYPKESRDSAADTASQPKETGRNVTSSYLPPLNENTSSYNQQQFKYTSLNQGRTRRFAFGVDDEKGGEPSRGDNDDGEDIKRAKSLYLRTGDTQPFCTYHYQVILELNEAFPKNKKPSMSLLMQDSESGARRRENKEQNTLSNDNFGDKYDDRTYTHLLTSAKKLQRIDHATLLFRDGLADGHRILKSIQINYMSHIKAQVRRQLSRRLCLVLKDVGGREQHQLGGSAGNRFYFEPCEGQQGYGSSLRPENYGHAADNHQPSNSNGAYNDNEHGNGQNGDYNYGSGYNHNHSQHNSNHMNVNHNHSPSRRNSSGASNW